MTSDETGMVAIFQSTLPREERRCMRVRIAAPLCNFNPRSHERSDIHIKFIAVMFLNFNPRSHERSDGIRDRADTVPDEISIHAPTRGATVFPFPLFYFLDISIHAPTRGATKNHLQEIRAFIISIHAPTRGATQSRQMHKRQQWNFNPRSHERSDGRYAQLTFNGEISIHAPTRGATLTQV